MTKEEAIKILRKEIECLSHTKCEDCILEAVCDPIKTTPYDSEYIEAYEMAIKALEQETCEDTISRQAVFEQIDQWAIGSREYQYTNATYYLTRRIQDIPSVNAEPKTGEWQQDLNGTYLCSECGSGFKEQPTLMGKPMFLWCPLCGARMKESGEA